MSADSPRRFVHHGAFGTTALACSPSASHAFSAPPRFIIGQTILVALWIAANAAAFSYHWDPYPFILLNLAFSTQAAYAAPLILLAQTRQAERDKLRDIAIQQHHEAEIDREQAFEARQTEVLARERALAEQHLTLLHECR